MSSPESRLSRHASIEHFNLFPCFIHYSSYSDSLIEQVDKMNYHSNINAIVNDETQGHSHFRIHSRDPQNCPQLPRPLQIILYTFFFTQYPMQINKPNKTYFIQ